MNRAERSPEQQQPTMKRTEKFLRVMGGYTLAFTGFLFEVGGVASINPFIAAAGGGLIYTGHRILEPAHDTDFGPHATELPKWRRAARFNASLIPTFIGASLLSTGIFGGRVNGHALNAGQRAVMGGVGLTTFLAGSSYERHLHAGKSLLPGVFEAPHTAQQPAETPTAAQHLNLLQTAKESFKKGYTSARAKSRQVQSRFA